MADLSELNLESSQIDINIILISNQQDVIDSVTSENNSLYSLGTHENYSNELYRKDNFIESDIVIYDLDTVADDISNAIHHLKSIKAYDPDKLLVLIGSNASLLEILSSDVKSIIYRAFKKPVHFSQMLLSFKSIVPNRDKSALKKKNIPADNESLDIEDKSDRGKSPLSKGKLLIFGAVGALGVAMVAAGLIFNDSDTKATSIAIPEIVDITPDASLNSNAENEEEKNRMKELSLLAEKAQQEGRITQPATDSALYYYNEILKIDPSDFIAFDRRQSIIDDLVNSFNRFIEADDFSQAVKVADIFSSAGYLDDDGEDPHEKLELIIKQRVDDVAISGDEERISQMTATLETLGPRYSGLIESIELAKVEYSLLNGIDQAIESNNLFPPTKDNAYFQIVEISKENTVSPEKIDSRKKLLVSKIMEEAAKDVDASALSEASQKLTLIKNLDIDDGSVTALTRSIRSKRNEIAQRKAAEDQAKEKAAAAASAKEENQVASASQEVVEEPAVAEEEKSAPPAKIIPASLVSRVNPDYPRRALSQNIEGWVQLSFNVNEEGDVTDINIIDAEPNNIFNRAAILAVRQWKFSPARNEETSEPIVFPVASVKLSFNLN